VVMSVHGESLSFTMMLIRKTSMTEVVMHVTVPFLMLRFLGIRDQVENN
jgi:hypothetical protein